MPEYPELFVLRHGQTEWNLAGRYQGRLDSDLTELGRQQAGSQGKILAQLSRGRMGLQAFSSPQGRAVATADLALEGLGLTAKADARLMEVAFGAWEGMTRLDIDRQYPGILSGENQDSWFFQSPGGEDYQAIADRIAPFLADLDGPSIIVTHGVTSKVVRGLWLGLTEAESLHLPHQQGCVYHLNQQREICVELADIAQLTV